MRFLLAAAFQLTSASLMLNESSFADGGSASETLGVETLAEAAAAVANERADEAAVVEALLLVAVERDDICRTTGIGRRVPRFLGDSSGDEAAALLLGVRCERFDERSTSSFGSSSSSPTSLSETDERNVEKPDARAPGKSSSSSSSTSQICGIGGASTFISLSVEIEGTSCSVLRPVLIAGLESFQLFYGSKNN